MRLDRAWAPVLCLLACLVTCAAPTNEPAPDRGGVAEIDSRAPATPPDVGGGDGPTIPDAPDDGVPSLLEARHQMRALWTDQASWTRFFLVSVLAQLPDTEAGTERLLENQRNIGDAFAPFYGEAAADELTVLLEEHVFGAADVVSALMSRDQQDLSAALDAWYANGDEIAVFLADANPHLSFDALQLHIARHLHETTLEARARVGGDYSGDVVAHDAHQAHVLELADVLVAGLATQFPDRFDLDSGLSHAGEELSLGMRKLWSDHVIWTRLFIIAFAADLPDQSFAAERLMQNQVEIGDALKPLYGEDAGNQLTALLREHIIGAVEVLTAAKLGDSERLVEAHAAWSANADATAAFLADANPNFDEAALRQMLHEHLHATTVEATARLTGDWSGDVAAYDEVVHHILRMSDALVNGIAAQFPDQLE